MFFVMLTLTDRFNYQMIDLNRVSCNLLQTYLLLTYGETFRRAVTCRKQVALKQNVIPDAFYGLFVKWKAKTYSPKAIFTSTVHKF